MKINQNFDCVEGSFDTDDGKLVSVRSEKHCRVDLCFAEKMNIAFAQIRLHGRDTYHEAKKVLDDAGNLGEEIAHRWNSHHELLASLQRTKNALEQYANFGQATEIIDEAEAAIAAAMRFNVKRGDSCTGE